MIMINILLVKNVIDQHQKKFIERLKQTNLASKSDIANFVKKTDVDVTSNENQSNKLSKKLKQYQQQN